MITDTLLRVSDGQALTTTAVSTNTIDLSIARDIGEGTELIMNFAVATALTGGTSVKFEVISSAAADLSTPTVIGSSDAIAAADLVAGKNVAVKINPSIASTGQRYLGARYTIVGTFSAGTVIADVVASVQDGKKFYASGFTVV
jgi:hypothetical protein